MRKPKFFFWLKSNKTFLEEPFASRKWDEYLSDSSTKQELRHHKKIQCIYSYFEAKIAHDYAKLFDNKLRTAFNQLSRSDFSDPSGFSDLQQASIGLTNFFEVRNTLQSFIKRDIVQHSQRDTQLHCFRRWISIAELLLKHHCYEGYFLVTTLLLQQDILFKFCADLPQVSQKSFQFLCHLASPENNFQFLREWMSQEKNKQALLPLFLFSKDLTMMNEVLGDKKNNKLTDTPINDPLYQSLARKESYLDDIIASRKADPGRLPTHLESTYKEAMCYYELSTLSPGKYTIEPMKTSKPSTLYTKDLLPSFWSRKCTANQHWENLYTLTTFPKTPGQ